MRSTMALLAMFAALVLSSCAERQSSVVDCADFVLSPTQYHIEFAGRAGMITQQEYTFICHATVLGRADLAFARMAQQQSTNPAVTEFAGKVISTQQGIDRNLTNIAEQQEGVSPPRGLDASGLAARDQLSGLSDGAFDRAYLQHASENSRMAIAAYKEEIASGSEPTLRAFATDVLPTLEERLAQSERVTAQLAK